DRDAHLPLGVGLQLLGVQQWVHLRQLRNRRPVRQRIGVDELFLRRRDCGGSVQFDSLGIDERFLGNRRETYFLAGLDRADRSIAFAFTAVQPEKNGRQVNLAVHPQLRGGAQGRAKRRVVLPLRGGERARR